MIYLETFLKRYNWRNRKYVFDEKGITFFKEDGVQDNFHDISYLSSFDKQIEREIENEKKKEILIAKNIVKSLTLKDILAYPNNSEKDYDILFTGYGSGWQGICNELDIDVYDKIINKNEYLYEQFVYSWLCTDTYVGLRAFYFHNELACIAYQTARKENGYFKWVSAEIRKRVKDYIYSLLEPIEDTNKIVDIIDMESTYLIYDILTTEKVFLHIDIEE